ncbi:hypothetical protein GCM10027026_08430 [Myroides odoratimimus subsp. xuanwuensis]
MILVDPRGWLLLQERDSHPVIDPDKWGLPGGHLDEGEDPEACAYRELEEETGVRLESGLGWWRDVEVFHEAYDSHDVCHVFLGATTLTDDDIVCGEGRRIVFVEPSAALSLDLTAAAAIVLPMLVGTDLHDQLTVAAGRPVPGPGDGTGDGAAVDTAGNPTDD